MAEVRGAEAVWLVLAAGATGCTGVNPAFERDGDGGTTTDAPPELEPGAELQDCATAWWDDRWPHRMRLDLRNDSLHRPLDDFPALVTLKADRFDFQTASANGADVRFVDPDCSELAHELAAWTDSEALAWVRVPQVQPRGRVDFIWLYWGALDEASRENPPGVWRDYDAVWHFDDSPDAATVVDEGRRDFDGVATGTMLDEGRVGLARRFVAGEPSFIDVPGGTLLFGGWGEFTFSHWIYLDYPDDASWTFDEPQQVITHGGGLTNGRTWREGWLEPGTGHFQTDFRFEDGGGQWQRFVLQREHWHHVVYQYDGQNYELYLDGQPYHRNPLADDRLVGGGQDFRLGNETNPFNGLLDEMTVEHRAHAPAWFAIQYASMTDALWNYGAIETQPDSDGG
jgi:hypothetical protein